MTVVTKVREGPLEPQERRVHKVLRVSQDLQGRQGRKALRGHPALRARADCRDSKVWLVRQAYRVRQDRPVAQRCQTSPATQKIMAGFATVSSVGMGSTVAPQREEAELKSAGKQAVEVTACRLLRLATTLSTPIFAAAAKKVSDVAITRTVAGCPAAVVFVISEAAAGFVLNWALAARF